MSEETMSLPRFETVCIEVPKVYDFCFQAERRENVCTPLIDAARCPQTPVSVNCVIKDTVCEEVNRSEPTKGGRANVTFAITVTYDVEVLNTAGEVIFTFEDLTFGFTKTVVLCAPEGTFTSCSVVRSACSCILLGTQICCTFDLCIIIQSLAIVKLLIPSFGFCTPSLCEQVSPVGPFVCPPVNLFPPQCRPRP